MSRIVKIGTRESELAVWQATSVQTLIREKNIIADLVRIRSEGDIDLATPLYEMGVQGIFTRALDIALLNREIDLAVHSYKDVPTQFPKAIVKAAVLKRASHKDILVHKGDTGFLQDRHSIATIATSSIRRKAQWLHRYPNHTVENLRGNVNTRLRKLAENDWQGAIFAAAGLERIGLRPAQSIVLDWMLPAPAQGAIIVLCREEDKELQETCKTINDPDTEICTHIERDFLRTLMGGCSTPISALAQISGQEIVFRANIVSPDGKMKLETEKILPYSDGLELGKIAGAEILERAGAALQEWFRMPAS